MLALSIEIAIRTSFEMSVYTFGGEIYAQLKGAPIGSRLTMVCVRLLMIYWDSKVDLKLRAARVESWMKGGYGWRFNTLKNKFTWVKNWNWKMTILR